MNNFLSGWKTYITAAAAIITSIAGYANGAITLPDLIAAIFAAVGTMTIRHAITTTATDTTGKPA